MVDGIRLLPKTRPSYILLPNSAINSKIIIISNLNTIIIVMVNFIFNTITFMVSSSLKTMLTCNWRYRAIFCWFTISDAGRQYHIGNTSTKRPILVLRAVVNSSLNTQSFEQAGFCIFLHSSIISTPMICYVSY